MTASFTSAAQVGDVIQPAGFARCTSNGPYRGHSGSRKGSFLPSNRALGALQRQLPYGPQPGGIVGGHRQQQQQVDHGLFYHHLAARADELAPAEVLLDTIPLAQADRIARVPCSATVDGAAAAAVEVLRDMRHDVDLAARLGEAPGVLRLVPPALPRAPGPASSASISAATSPLAVPSKVLTCTHTTRPWRLSVDI